MPWSLIAPSSRAQPLERLTKPKIEDAMADEGGGKFPEGIIETGTAFVADSEAGPTLHSPPIFFPAD